MADLRAAYVDVGCTDVSTLLNSGNVVLTAPSPPPADLAAVLEEVLLRRTGVQSSVVLLTAAELATAVADNPLLDRATDPTRLMLAVFRTEPGTVVHSLLQTEWAPEALALGPRVAYLWCPNGVLASPLAAALGRLVGPTVTTRNWATVTKLQAALSAGSVGSPG